MSQQNSVLSVFVNSTANSYSATAKQMLKNQIIELATRSISNFAVRKNLRGVQ